ncbi:MAG: translocation/assembly module TamB domain-containing protein [Rhodoferax sp.]|nr:translocation/assembly module TamB domain-containing protein [Rhodoferax sp.]
MKKWLKVTLLGLLALLLLVVGLVGGVWVWGGSSTSLAAGLAHVARYLPAGQSLHVEAVSGSLREGGQIGNLRWSRGALQVQARDIRLGWSLRPLWDGELQLGQLNIRELRIEDGGPPEAPADKEPFGDLRLPLKLSVAFAVDRVVWVGPPALEATGLTGSYRFDSASHILDVRKVQIASGIYQLKASLQAQAPMALAAQLEGTVTAPIPSSKQTMTVAANATLAGPLAGQDDRLQLTADLRPQSGGVADGALRATLAAELAPWKVQPLARVAAKWQALNLAALWPQAPQTQLAGDAHVTPSGALWQAGVQLRNTGSGPWDSHRLPLERLEAQLTYREGQWALQSLQARGAGGQLQASGRASGLGQVGQAAPAWQVTASAHGINPHKVLSRLDAVLLDGHLAAQQTPGGIRFDTQLQSTGDQGAVLESLALRGLKLQVVQAQGTWRDPALQLDKLLVQTSDARLQGTVALDTLNGSVTGRLALTVPGGQALVDGSLASDRGAGTLTATVTDAARTTQWLDRLTGAPERPLAEARPGSAELRANWAGGWQTQGQNPGVALTLHAKVAQDPHRLTLDATGQGGRVGDTSLWQGTLGTANLQMQSLSKPGIWNLYLNDTVGIKLRQDARGQALEVMAGAARLTGPAPGTAQVQWQAARWAQASTAPATPARWQSQGTLQDLPLGWLELLGQTQIANLGLKGDLVFGGQWDATGDNTLKMRATLQRTRGDLQLQADDGRNGPIPVGLRDASLVVAVDHDRVNATLLWDSERGGTAQANFATRILRSNGAWSWPADAPLSGSLNAKLPPVGAWSVLAPPGWRMRGTLDANATLSGTVASPRWRGKLQAQDLAVRSVVDGIDFSQGTLRASLDGQRLEIEEFKLYGAAGPSSGQLAVKGAVTWLPANTPATSAAARLHMELVGTAQGLRVSARDDRRLVVSGEVSAQLSDARLRIAGTLRADQALFILPEDSAPHLGDDVRVRRPIPHSPTQPASEASAVRVVPDVALSLDLGDNFEVRGRGVATRLAGTLELRSNAQTRHGPRLTGQLRTVRGTYKAYGQELDVEYGVLRFTGPFDNPALDVLAIRPNLSQRVGVQISGTALAPVVRLYAEPDLPDTEKLAWLVLGRSAADGGAEAAMLQQAAMALLGGSGPGLTSGLAESLGLSQLSVRSATTVGDGETGGATVTLGKRVSREFYIAYESSMTGAMGTLSIFYDLSRRLSLRAQGGEQSAVDLVFTLRYD